MLPSTAQRAVSLLAVTLGAILSLTACSHVTERRAESAEASHAGDWPTQTRRAPSLDTVVVRHELDQGTLTLALRRQLRCIRSRPSTEVRTVTVERTLGDMVYVEEAVAVGAFVTTALLVNNETRDCTPEREWCGMDAVPIAGAGGAVVAGATIATAVDWIRGVDSVETTTVQNDEEQVTECGAESLSGAVEVRLPDGTRLTGPMDPDGMVHINLGADAQERFGTGFVVELFYNRSLVGKFSMRQAGQ